MADELRLKLEEMERKYNRRFRAIFDALSKLLETNEEPGHEVGFRSGRDS